MNRALGQRIKTARKGAGLTQAPFAARVGAHEKSVSRWETGATSPDAVTLDRIAEVTGVSAGWLRTGQGEMKTAPAASSVASPQVARAVGLVTERDDETAVSFVEVPVFGQASAGDGVVPTLQVERYVNVPVGAFQQEFRRTPPTSGRSQRLGYFEVRGDSAAPSYFDGELVPVELVEQSPEERFNNDNVYVFRWEDMVLLKRLRREPGRRIVASSLNPSISPFHFTPAEGEFEVLGRVIEGVKQQLYTALVGRLLDIHPRPN